MPYPTVSLLERLFGLFFRPLRPWAVIPLACSFCGRSQHDVLKLIAGPTVYVCDGCAKEAGRVLADGKGRAGRCSFCGKDASVFSRSVEANAPAICDECVTLCRDILAEEIDRMRLPPPRR